MTLTGIYLCSKCKQRYRVKQQPFPKIAKCVSCGARSTLLKKENYVNEEWKKIHQERLKAEAKHKMVNVDMPETIDE